MQNNIDLRNFPTTRYQGSKRRILPWIYDILQNLKFNSVLDLFGGTASVSYLFKKMGKRVTYNDILNFNYLIGIALIENSKVKLSEDDITYLLKKHKNIDYPSFIQDTFKDIYYLDDENKFLDMIIKNIQMLKQNYRNEKIAFFKSAMAYYSLFQSCIIKRPFNLFHRKNLYIRTNDVKRNFGNKTTWEKSFNHFFIKFAIEADRLLFDNGRENKSVNFDAQNFPNDDYDLVYLDPPYAPKKIPRNICNYHKYYHFLEGLTRYDDWDNLIDTNFQHRPLIDNGYNWKYQDGNLKGFEKIIGHFQDSIVIISYKEPGLPSIDELVTIIKQFKKTTINIYKTPHFYALNKNNGHYQEVLIVAG